MNEQREHDYAFDDYRNDLPPRAMGSETEYTNDCNVEKLLNRSHYGGLNRKLTHFIHPRYFISPGRHTAPSAVTSNGGEVYLDVTVLEYATPECTSSEELVLHERSGEQIICDTIARIGLSNRLQPKVYKRSGYVEVWAKNHSVPILDETSIGHHESYTSLNVFSAMPLANRENEMCRNTEARQFADYLALRKLIDGVGMVAGDHFSITQKPRAIDYNSFTRDTGRVGKKPFQQKMSRLEVRSGEGNKSDWAVEFKAGLTSLVLRLIEHRSYPKQLKLYDPNTAVLRIARDPMADVLLESGAYMKAVDVLKGIVDAAYELGQKFENLPAYEQKAYNDFIQFYDDLHKVNLKENDVSALSDRIDWAARYEFLMRRGASYDTITTDDLQQVQYDLLWDRIGEKDIARKWFSRFGHTALSVEIPAPPQTRAETRVQIAKELYAAGTLRNVDWNNISTNDGHRYISRHPLSKTMERIEDDQPTAYYS
ncbi:MAG: proteasome accessory factor PafA2 family protein [Candidatus Nomurabacteria bacterium]|nr:MAG: proteasome accessory factor PafA2 family protein [Candidatus Nomurabacteria bacterium]